MPKTAMNEDDLSMTRKDEVWCAGKFANVESVAIAKCVRNTANRKFGRCVFRADSRHILGPSSWSEMVRHLSGSS